MRTLKRHWLIPSDIAAAYRWYERQQKGLGRRFNRELRQLLNRLPIDPLLFSVRFGDIRRANLPSFPYGVFYLVSPEALVVIGVLHAARDSQAELENRRRSYI